MAVASKARKLLPRFWSDQSGAALVEFAACLPLMLILFAFIVEGAFMLWTHQVVVGGVRDAARYVARVNPRDVCSGGTVSPSAATLTNIVSHSQGASSTNLLKSHVTLNSVNATAAPAPAGTYRVPVCVATVTANLTITHPFGALFSLAGGAPGPLTYTVSDMARIHGE